MILSSFKIFWHHFLFLTPIYIFWHHFIYIWHHFIYFWHHFIYFGHHFYILTSFLTIFLTCLASFKHFLYLFKGSNYHTTLLSRIWNGFYNTILCSLLGLLLGMLGVGNGLQNWHLYIDANNNNNLC